MTPAKRLAGHRLEARLGELRRRGGRALAPYVTAGDGGLDVTCAAVRALERAGAACVELGFPFSDPIADGPTLQAAADRALARGTTFEGVLEAIARLRRGADGAPACDVPIAFMTYANPLHARGLERAARELAQAGADAWLVPDVPAEEGGEFAAAALSAGLAPVFFVAPTTSPERLEKSIALSRGFVYAIGRFGVTGASTRLHEDADGFLQRVRALAGDTCVAVGFGIDSPERVRAALRHADLAIVGSALVERIHRAASAAPAGRAAERAAQASTDFMAELSAGLPS